MYSLNSYLIYYLLYIFQTDVATNTRQFILHSTSGTRQISEWDIGDHVRHGVQTEGVNTDWYADSCWDKVLENDESGNEIYGSKSDLIAKANIGHKVKVVFNMFSVEVTEILIKNDHLCAFIYNSLSKSTIGTFSTSVHWEWMILCTNGTKNTAQYEYGSDNLNGTMSEKVSMMWYVDKRDYHSVYSTNSTNSVSKGDKDFLLLTVRSGADVRMKVNNGSGLYTIFQAESIWIDIALNELEVMFTRSISLLHDLDGGFTIPLDAFHIYTFFKTDGSVEYGRWTVGEHEYRGGEINDSIFVEWIICF